MATTRKPAKPRARRQRGFLIPALAVLAAVHFLGAIGYLVVPAKTPAHPVVAAVTLCLIGISMTITLPFQYHRQETEIELAPDVTVDEVQAKTEATFSVRLGAVPA